MSCPTFSVEGIGQELYAKLMRAATAAGASIDGTKVQYRGCQFEFAYDQGAQVLAVTCVSKPFLVGCDTIEEKIRALVAQAKREEF